MTARSRARLAAPMSGETTTTLRPRFEVILRCGSSGQAAGSARKLVHRDAEEALNLLRMQVKRDDAVGAGDGDQVGQAGGR